MNRLGIVSLTALLSVGGPSFAEVQFSTSMARQPDIAWNGTCFGVIFPIAHGTGDATLITVDPPGLNPSPEVTLWGPGPLNPVIVAGPGVWGAAWKQPEFDGRKIYFAAFDDAGKFSIPPMQISGTVGNPNEGGHLPSIVWTGSRFYVAWEYHLLNARIELDVAAIDPDGTISIPWQTVVPAPWAFWPWMAWNSNLNTMGLAWVTYTTDAIYRGANLAPTGFLSGSVSDISLPPGENMDGRLGAGGTGFGFGCRSRYTTGSLNQGDLYFTPLDVDMDPVSAPVPLTNGEDNQRTGNLIWTGVGFIWPVEHIESGASIYEYLYRFEETGTLIGPPVRLFDQVEGWVGSQYGPRAAFANNNVLGIAWQHGPSFTPHIYYEYVPTSHILVGGGAGAGNPAEVRSLSAFHGDRILDLAPYAAGYGASVGAGNIETNPLDEILTGPGPGAIYGPQVRAFRGNEKPMPAVNFYAYRTLKYGAEVAGGDVEADGYGEILTGPDPGLVFGAQLRGFNYDNNGVASIPGVNAIIFPGTDFGLLVGAGDVTGDGRDELLASPGPDPVGLTRSEVRMFSYAGGLTKIGSVAPFTFAGGCHIAAADMDVQAAPNSSPPPPSSPQTPAAPKPTPGPDRHFRSCPSSIRMSSLASATAPPAPSATWGSRPRLSGFIFGSFGLSIEAHQTNAKHAEIGSPKRYLPAPAWSARRQAADGAAGRLPKAVGTRCHT